LSRIGFVKPKDVRDLAVWIVERLTKDVGGSCGGRQLFQQQQHPKRQRLASFRTQPRVGAGIDWLQPGSNVRLSARARRLHDVDRQSPRCRHEECRGIPNPAAIGRLPAYPNVLHDVFGRGFTVQHPVGDAKETRTYAQECREAVVSGRVHGSSGR
jgi:hypothetical protein